MGQDTRFWIDDFNREQGAAIRKALEMFVKTYEQKSAGKTGEYSYEECHRVARNALDMVLR